MFLAHYITGYLRANFCLLLPSYIGQWTYVKNLGGGGDVVSNNRNNSQVNNFGFHVTREVHLHCNQKRMIAIIQLETPRTSKMGLFAILLTTLGSLKRVPPHTYLLSKTVTVESRIIVSPQLLIFQFFSTQGIFIPTPLLLIFSHFCSHFWV